MYVYRTSCVFHLCSPQQSPTESPPQLPAPALDPAHTGPSPCSAHEGTLNPSEQPAEAFITPGEIVCKKKDHLLGGDVDVLSDLSQVLDNFSSNCNVAVEAMGVVACLGDACMSLPPSLPSPLLSILPSPSLSPPLSLTYMYHIIIPVM